MKIEIKETNDREKLDDLGAGTIAKLVDGNVIDGWFMVLDEYDPEDTDLHFVADFEGVIHRLPTDTEVIVAKRAELTIS